MHGACFLSLIRPLTALLGLGMLIACSSGNADPVRDRGGRLNGGLSLSGSSYESSGHLQAVQSILFDPASGTVEILRERATATHLDLAYFWKYYPDMLSIRLLGYDPVAHELDLEITFTNPLGKPLRDIRAIFEQDAQVVPLTIDGWSIRGGAPVENPDPYFAFAASAPYRSLEPKESSIREIVFGYRPPLDPMVLTFVLDATVNSNTAEPYWFGTPELTGRLFHVAISDWQDDITGVFLDATPCGLTVPLRLAAFGDEGEWGTSIPDIPEGDYRLLLKAASPESVGEIGEGEPATAVSWVDLHWPPDGPLVPLPSGHGIYCYSFIDPDANTPPVNAAKFISRFRGDMGGEWLIMEYGEICNSGYLSMHSWVPLYVQWIHQAAPDLPIHLNLDNLGFPPPSQDPCHHSIENYTKTFFDNLLASIKGQILKNSAFDAVSGIHLDIEVFPSQYPPDELFAIYARYADFLARLHLEPELRGRNITIYEFDIHPRREAGDLAYLCTTDAFLGEGYFCRFAWDWVAGESATPFDELGKILGTYRTWGLEYGRPYYPILATFSGWMDGNKDTVVNYTPCPSGMLYQIDDHCFGTGDFKTINEFDIVRMQDVHGMVVEKVILNLPSGEQIFPANGFAVYLLGDGDPDTPCDDVVFCRTAYSVARARDIMMEAANPLTLGSATFRFENNSYWKAAALARPLGRGDITAVAGTIRFGDGLDIRHHPELWGGITIELLDPLTPEILGHPAYRTSIDIVGVVDGSYLFPDLPRAVVTIQAVADGWASDPVMLDMTGNFAYRDNIDLILKPE